MITQVTASLYRSCRPGYPSRLVEESEVSRFIQLVKQHGISTIIVLLDHDQLQYYHRVTDGLIGRYTSEGF
ncbi:MAG: hypothetical protein ACLFVQ_06475, partial [Chitinispirillaceae bacterium]